MKNNVKKSLFIFLGCLLASVASATDVTFVMSSIFDGSSQSATVTTPVAATITTTASKSNAKDGKLGSDGNYFQIVLTSNTFTAASINGFINTNSTDKNWAFQFSTDGGTTWSSEATQANDGTKSAHDIAVGVTIPANANGFRVVRRAGTSTVVNSITLTISGSTPSTVAVTGVTLNKTTTSIVVGASETLTATVSPSNATNKAVTWSSSNTNIATVSNGVVSGVAAGTATITATTTDGGFTAQCNVTVTAAPTDPVLVTGITLNKSSETIKVGNTLTITATVSPNNATNQTLNWTSSNTSIATVSNGVVTGVAAGTATITASSTDGSNKSATCQVTVEENTTPVPPTTLTKHEPEVYEAAEVAGGYGGKLSIYQGREYEVYYAGKTTDSYMTVDVKPCQKQPGITNTSSSTACTAKDGWFEAKGNSISNYTFPDIDEFSAGDGCMHKIYNNNAYKFHIQGYDQFSFYGKDNSTTIDPNNASKNKRFQVYIDNVLQPESPSTTASIRRYNISTGEHVIEVRGIGASNNEFYGWSLRLAQEPRTKHITGNDSTQAVLQTQAIKPIVYATKYNNIQGAETRLEWTGSAATGISLSKTIGDLSDTLTIGGVANCPTGTYNYAVVAYYNGQETNRVTGKFTVKSDINALTDNLNITVYNGEAMEQIKFRYYALSANDVQLTWGTNGQPSGISGSGSNGTYTIGGTPNISSALPKTFPYEITVVGADTVFKGAITVKELIHTDKDVLFLYENTTAENAPLISFLQEKGWNPIDRKALDQLRPANQYSAYKWILISEDVNANNAEVLAVARGEAGLPVLNMKSFSYSPDRLNWGEPDNGTLDTLPTTQNRYNIFVQRADHPIFKALGWKQGDRKAILSNIDRKGLMPVNVDYDGTLCLATAYTRSIQDYYKDGELQTFLHEVPASMRNGKKYLCLPIAYSSCQYLNKDGKDLLKAAIDYLTSNDATVALPELEITRFAIGDIAGEINQMDNTILVEINEKEHPDLELTALKPAITLKDPTLTHVSPASDEEENFASSIYVPIEYVVSDYINRRVYEVTVRKYSPQGIDEAYTDGEWVNVYDIYGRLLTTTNENIYTMDLPRGMYLIITSGGQTIKLMK